MNPAHHPTRRVFLQTTAATLATAAIAPAGETAAQPSPAPSRTIGIQVGGAPGLISDNVVYGNTNQGIYMQNALNPQLYNNTVYLSAPDHGRPPAVLFV